MKLLCVSHPCVVPSNQEFFECVARVTSWDVTIVVPKRWKNELSEFHAVRWHAFSGALRPLRVVGVGSVPLHIYAARFTQLLRGERPDAVYVHNEPYALSTCQVFRAVARAAPEVPVGFYSAQNIHKAYPWPIRIMEALVHRQAAFALPVSDTVHDVLRAKGYRGPTKVLPLAVDTATRPMGRRTAGGGLTIGFVGRLVPEKGVDVLLEALALLPASVRAVVAGAGPHAGALRARATALRVDDRVEWLGYIQHSEAHRVIAGFDLLVVPSRSVAGWREQFGRVVLEALAVDVPVVVSDCGELPELVRETGGGWIFPEGDARALAQVIGTLAADVNARERVARRGRNQVVRRFGIDAVAVQFAEAIEEARRRSAWSRETA